MKRTMTASAVSAINIVFNIINSVARDSGWSKFGTLPSGGARAGKFHTDRGMPPGPVAMAFREVIVGIVCSALLG